MADFTPDKTDRRRLQQIQQQDLMESRLNQDFVNWLKTKGMNWLLLALLCLCAFMGWNWYRDRQSKARDAAWAGFDAATMPAAFEEVAATHPGVDSVDALALLAAADRYMASLQSGVRFDREAGAADARLTPELRAEWLATANSLYDQAIAKSGPVSPESRKLIVALSAMFGKAAVAESRGDVAAAKKSLEDVAAAAAHEYPPLAKLADARRLSLDGLNAVVVLPSKADLPTPAPMSPIEAPVVDDQFIRELLVPPGSMSTTSSAPQARPASGGPAPSVPAVGTPNKPPAGSPGSPPTTSPTAPPVGSPAGSPAGSPPAAAPAAGAPPATVAPSKPTTPPPAAPPAATPPAAKPASPAPSAPPATNPPPAAPPAKNAGMVGGALGADGR